MSPSASLIMRDRGWRRPQSRSREHCAPRGAPAITALGDGRRRGGGGEVPGLGSLSSLPCPHQASQWPPGVSKPRGRKVNVSLCFPKVACPVGLGAGSLSRAHIASSAGLTPPEPFGVEGKACVVQLGGTCLTSRRLAEWGGGLPVRPERPAEDKATGNRGGVSSATAVNNGWFPSFLKTEPGTQAHEDKCSTWGNLRTQGHRKCGKHYSSGVEIISANALWEGQARAVPLPARPPRDSPAKTEGAEYKQGGRFH